MGDPFRHADMGNVGGTRREVTLSPTAAAGTEIHWHSTFRPIIPDTGWAIRRKLSRVIGEGAARLAQVAET
jgi:hypothetical protein